MEIKNSTYHNNKQNAGDILKWSKRTDSSFCQYNNCRYSQYNQQAGTILNMVPRLKLFFIY